MVMRGLLFPAQNFPDLFEKKSHISLHSLLPIMLKTLMVPVQFGVPSKALDAITELSKFKVLLKYSGNGIIPHDEK